MGESGLAPDAACRFVSVRVAPFFCDVAVRFGSCRKSVTCHAVRVTRVNIQFGALLPHALRVTRVNIVACHACCVSCVSGSVAVRFVSVSGSCVFAVRVCFCASL